MLEHHSQCSLAVVPLAVVQSRYINIFTCYDKSQQILAFPKFDTVKCQLDKMIWFDTVEFQLDKMIWYHGRINT